MSGSSHDLVNVELVNSLVLRYIIGEIGLCNYGVMQLLCQASKLTS